MPGVCGLDGHAGPNAGPTPTPRPNKSSRARFPPQAHTTDQGHGRIEDRRLWTRAVEGATLGLAGAAQIFRLDQQVDYLWCGQAIQKTRETHYGVLSLTS